MSGECRGPGRGADRQAGSRGPPASARRDAEAWIAARRVAVDGMVLETPAVRARPGQRVTVDGKLLPAAEATRLFRYHKPKGVVTAARDPKGGPRSTTPCPRGCRA